LSPGVLEALGAVRQLAEVAPLLGIIGRERGRVLLADECLNDSLVGPQRDGLLRQGARGIPRLGGLFIRTFDRLARV
jgi:hypothetical protein